MKRRELLKSGIMGIGASAIALTGCDKKDVAIEKSVPCGDDFDIVPKQTGLYEFSCPLPFDFKVIDEIAELNKTLKKSKITNLFNNIPSPLDDNFNHWLHIKRGENPNIKTYSDFFKYVNYAKEKGFKFSYLMNSPKPFSERDFNSFKKDYNKLIDSLIKNNVRNIKVANAQTAQAINDYAPNQFILSASCAFEYYNIMQYENLFSVCPNFDTVDITYDKVHDFKYLKNLKEKFPNITFEAMVNETCYKGCPVRVPCIAELGFLIDYGCNGMRKILGFSKYFSKTAVIYPWNLEYYSAIGINNFKFPIFVNQSRVDIKDLTPLKNYLMLAEGQIDDLDVRDFLSIYLNNKEEKIKEGLKLSDIRDVLPDIKYFIKHGADCTAKCGAECNYCYECAKKIEKILLYG